MAWAPLFGLVGMVTMLVVILFIAYGTFLPPHRPPQVCRPGAVHVRAFEGWVCVRPDPTPSPPVVIEPAA